MAAATFGCKRPRSSAFSATTDKLRHISNRRAWHSSTEQNIKIVLEIKSTGNRTVGTNPTPSANQKPYSKIQPHACGKCTASRKFAVKIQGIEPVVAVEEIQKAQTDFTKPTVKAIAEHQVVLPKVITGE